MSPCEPLPASGIVPSSAKVERLLKEFAISSNGFLPDHVPLGRLQTSSYAPWESLMDGFSESLESGTLREQVNNLSTLSIDKLNTDTELRRAYVILCFLAHGYIWGGDKASEILPPQITTPLLQISSILGIPPVATYASLNLWNFRTLSLTSDLRDLDNIRSLHTFTGTEDESWFYAVSIAIEAQGAPIIPIMLNALEASRRRGYAILATALDHLTKCIAHLGHVLDRMDEKCNPNTFYHHIRPFLAGSKNMAAAGLPRGVFYDEGNGNGEWRQLRGGSNGQSSLIQFFDVVLGVEHATGGGGHGCMEGKKEPSFHDEVRGYMPKEHRRFLEFVAESFPGGIRRALVDTEDESDGMERELCLAAFRVVTEALAAFRGKHLQMVTRYIIIPSRQACSAGAGVINLATASAEGWRKSEGVELTGTGGTDLLPFLKGSRDETTRTGDIR